MDDYTVRIGAWAQVPDATAIRCVVCHDGSVELNFGGPGMDLLLTETSARRCLDALATALATPTGPTVTAEEWADSEAYCSQVLRL